MNEKIREKSIIRVVDDDAAMRRSWQFLLEGEGWTTRAYDSATMYMQMNDPSIPGCLVLDVRMPEMSGIELQRELSVRNDGIPIIFVSAHGDIDMAVQALKDGAVDFLPKPVKADRLISAISKAVELDWKRRENEHQAGQVRAAYDKLTDREKLIARKVGEGLLNKQIAHDCNISEKTVQAHRSSVFRKLKVRGAAELATLLSRLDETH